MWLVRHKQLLLIDEHVRIVSDFRASMPLHTTFRRQPCEPPLKDGRDESSSASLAKNMVSDVALSEYVGTGIHHVTNPIFRWVLRVLIVKGTLLEA